MAQQKTGSTTTTDLTPEELAAVIAAAREAKSVDPWEREEARKRSRMRYRLRRQARPHYMLAGLLLSAGAARIAYYATDDAALVATSVASVALTITLVAAVMLRKRIRRAHRRRVACRAAAASIWLTITAGVGITWETVALLLIAGYTAALPWWRQHRIPNPDAIPLTDAGEELDLSIPAMWLANIGGKSGGVLPGSYLTNKRDTKHGEQYEGQVRPGRQSIANVRAALPLIASGLRREVDQLVVDRHPSRDASRFLLTVVTRSPIAERVLFPGPQYDPASGTVALGPWADGEGLARWRIYTENSMWGGVLIGGPGSGKSRMVENLAISVAASGCTALLFGDPQYGSSSKNLAKYATWPARGIDEIATMIEALERACQIRSKENALLGLEGFTPSPERPGLLAIIDEFHRVAAIKELAVLMEFIAREGRKLGIAIVAISQYSGLKTFAGNEALRSAVMAGNAVALYVASKSSGGLMAGLDFDPSQLPPDRPGIAYLKGQDRSAPFRGFFLEDPEYWWKQTNQPPLDDVVLRAFGPDFTDRAARDEAIKAQLRAEVYGTPLPADAAAVLSTTNRRPFTTTTGMGEVVTFPEALGKVAVPQLTGAQLAVLNAVRNGNTTPAAIRTATGWSETYVRRLLGELIDLDLITKADRGQYVATDAKSAA